MSSFMCVSFTITLRQKPKGVTRSRRRTSSLSVELQDRERACWYYIYQSLKCLGLLYLGLEEYVYSTWNIK